MLALLFASCMPAAGMELSWSRIVSGEDINDLAVSEDRTGVALGTSTGGVYFYDGEGTLCWSARHKGAMRVEIAPDASLVVAGESESREKDKGALRAYDRGGNLLWMKHTGWICGFYVSGDLARIGVGNRLGQIGVYDRGGFDEIWEDNLLKRYSAVSAMAMSSDGKYLAYSLFENTPAIYLLNVDTWAGRTIKSVFREHGSAVHTLRLSGNGTYLLAASGEGSTDTLYLFTNRGVMRWKETVPHILDMEISSDGAVCAIGSDDGCIRVYDPVGNLVWSRCMDGAVQSLSLTPQGDLLAAGSRGGEILVFSGNGTILWEHRVARFPTASIDAVEFSFGGDALVAVVNGKEVIFFSTGPESDAIPPSIPELPVEPAEEPDCPLTIPHSVAGLFRGDMGTSETGILSLGKELRRVFHSGI